MQHLTKAKLNILCSLKHTQPIFLPHECKIPFRIKCVCVWKLWILILYHEIHLPMLTLYWQTCVVCCHIWWAKACNTHVDKCLFELQVHWNNAQFPIAHTVYTRDTLSRQTLSVIVTDEVRHSTKKTTNVMYAQCPDPIPMHVMA